MKCENCGGNLSLEDVACPYCGTVNKHAQQHIRDMKRYQGEFQSTRKNVYAVTRKYAGITVRAVVITALVILTVIMGVIASESYSIKRNIRQKQAERHFDKYAAQMETYLADEDYLAFHAFAEAHYIDGDDTSYEKYIPAIRVSSQYFYLYETIMGAYTRLHRDYADQETLERQTEYVAEQLNYFYEALDMENYSYYEGADSQLNRDALAGMERNAKALLQTYCGISPEEAENLAELSGAKRMVLLEERMRYGE